MKGERVVLAGGSGFLGTLLARELIRRGADVTILSRDPAVESDGIKRVTWDGRTCGRWAEQVEGALAVVNLAGRSVNCRPTVANRRAIIDSRVNSVKILGEAIRRCTKPPRAFVQAAAQGIYGDIGEDACEESSPPGKGFLVETCRLWEAAFNESLTPSTRRVLVRIGFVLGVEGGALPPLAALTRWGLGGTVGSGKQWVSWIHSQDIARIFAAAIEREDFDGLYNASAPKPVTNAVFMRELRRALGRPWSPPAPAWAIRLGAWLMGTDGRLALTGRRCLPTRLLNAGFEFSFPQLAPALADLTRNS